MKVSIYARVSTTKQEVENQLLQIRSYCQRQNYEVIKEYVDEAISGTKESRPAFDQLFQDAHKGLFDLVIFWDLSRFSRSGTLYTLQKLKELENCKIAWHSFNEPYFSSAGQFKDVVISIMATLAKIEREKISLRTKAGLLNAQGVGKRGKDKRPRSRKGYFGLKRGGSKKEVEKPLETASNDNSQTG